MKPLVSAIMPTGGRPNYVRHAIEMFLGQTWPNKELIILDDSLPDRQLPRIWDSRIKQVRLVDEIPMGQKHDMAIGIATGEYLCHWDDDDWYSPHRLANQVVALEKNNAEVCGFLRDLVLFTSGKWCRLAGPAELSTWIGNSVAAYSKYHFHDGTAMFRRSVLREIPRYGLASVSQKTHFLNEIVNRGIKYVDVPNGNDFVYIRHDHNSWQPVMSKCLTPADAPDWFPEKEFEFYTKTKTH